MIDESGVTIIPKKGEVWMTQNEIASTFGVFVSAVGANVRSILKNGLLREEAVKPPLPAAANGRGGMVIANGVG